MATASAAVLSQMEPLTENEMLECAHAFEDIGRAYSSRQFEVMQDLFCCMSNKIVRIGRERLDATIDPLKTAFRECFWHVDRNLLDFDAVSEFDRYIRTNVAAAEMLGSAIAANDCYNASLNHYDMVVFKGVTAYLKKFKGDGEEQLAHSAEAHLDEWKNTIIFKENSIVADLDENIQNTILKCIINEQIERFNSPREYLDIWDEYVREEVY